MLRLFVLAFLLSLAAAATDYCKLCSDHVMCKYPSATPGKACKNYQKPSMSASDKTLIVRLLNEYRNKVALGQEKRGKNNPQPSASNMRKISWDDEITVYAQRWADQCTFEHDTCHTTQDGTISGQNLLLGGLAPNQTKPDWPAAIKIWYEEVIKRDGSLNTKPFKADATFMDVGHYTQVAWAETYAVGCAYSTYTAGSGSAPDTQLVVCDFKPSGNFEGDIMYQGGTPASKCPAGTKKDTTYPGLCASSSQTSAAASVASQPCTEFCPTPTDGAKPVKTPTKSSPSKGKKQKTKKNKAKPHKRSHKVRSHKVKSHKVQSNKKPNTP